QLDFKELVARVLTFDYIGALAASVLFPLFFVPRLGLVRTSLVTGMCNALVALWGTWLLRPLLESSPVGLRVRAVLLLALLGPTAFEADRIVRYAEEVQYEGQVVFSRTTPYQRIVVVSNSQGFQLHLNSHLQFSSFDEYRYHESLAHPALLACGRP